MSIYSNSDEPDYELEFLIFCPECGDADVSAYEDTTEGETDGLLKEKAKKTPIIIRYKGARNDATIGAICRKIEAGFRLHKGSVKLCKPDEKLLRDKEKIAKLRILWEKEDKKKHKEEEKRKKAEEKKMKEEETKKNKKNKNKENKKKN